jgi:hypothetical protein
MSHTHGCPAHNGCAYASQVRRYEEIIGPTPGREQEP